jgi:hypothetical protein
MHWFWRATIAALCAAVSASLLLAITLLNLSPPKRVFGVAVATVFVNEFLSALVMYRRFYNVETRCRKCGYILRGITEPRCPECGERI